MDILISYRYREDDLAPLPLEELTRFVLESERRPDATEVSVSFVDDAVIAELNEKYRGKQGPTDVLSFECDNLEDGFPEGEGAQGYLLGDIVIAPDVAARQAAEYGHGFLEEVDLLVVHGVLHLCGYDHIDDEEAREMEALQDAIVAAWAAHWAKEAASGC